MASTSRRSKSSTPLDWDDKDFIYEHDIDLQSLQGTPLSQFVLTTVGQDFLLPLMTPLRAVYPRVVREFYRSMTCEIDEQSEEVLSITVTVDGFTATIRPVDIAVALHLTGHTGEDVFRVDPPSVPAMVTDLIEGRFESDVVRRSYLHPSMWLVDHIFQHNLCPVGHHQERRPPFLRYLHAAYKGYYVDAPQLIITTMVRIKKDTRTPPFPMAYPRYITSILHHLGYVFSPIEERKDDFPVFNADTWEKSLPSLRRVTGFFDPAEPQQRQRRRTGPRAAPRPIPADPPAPPARTSAAPIAHAPQFQMTQA